MNKISHFSEKIRKHNSIIFSSVSTTCIIYSGGMREKFQILTPQIHITQSYETIIIAFSDIYSS